ncbi:MAG: hypothetical protein BWX88_05354 [Planctomycetes bacterium ADurb.Bin126]|nr:MAG: hypothetical protein BWX88_05354 [Planctomycetes bacterium ADurb.Bin126]
MRAHQAGVRVYRLGQFAQGCLVQAAPAFVGGGHNQQAQFAPRRRDCVLRSVGQGHGQRRGIFGPLGVYRQKRLVWAFGMVSRQQGIASRHQRGRRRGNCQVRRGRIFAAVQRHAGQFPPRPTKGPGHTSGHFRQASIFAAMRKHGGGFRQFHGGGLAVQPFHQGGAAFIHPRHGQAAQPVPGAAGLVGQAQAQAPPVKALQAGFQGVQAQQHGCLVGRGPALGHQQSGQRVNMRRGFPGDPFPHVRLVHVGAGGIVQQHEVRRARVPQDTSQAVFQSVGFSRCAGGRHQGSFHGGPVHLAPAVTVQPFGQGFRVGIFGGPLAQIGQHVRGKVGPLAVQHVSQGAA